MELGCIFSYINKIGAISNKFLAKRIKEEGLPILQNHSLLFYILPKDKSHHWKIHGVKSTNKSKEIKTLLYYTNFKELKNL